MDEKEFKRLADRYSKGEHSAEEEKIFNTFFESLLEDEGRFDARSEAEKYQIKAELYRKVHRRIRKGRPFIAADIFLRVAASVAIVFAIGIGLYLTLSPSQKYITYQTGRGERTTVKLGDGSIVHLNDESSLTVPEHFASKTREVTLEGEAYFEVKRDTKRQFIVNSGPLKTIVLGTSFNIEAYANEKQSSVSVVSGKVKVKMANSGKTDSLLLLPGEQAHLNYNHRLEKKQVNTADLISWKDGVLFFDDISLAEVAQQLERRYNVTIVFGNESLRDCFIKAKYKNESLQSVLNSMGYFLNMQYSMQHDSVHFSGEGCK